MSLDLIRSMHEAYIIPSDSRFSRDTPNIVHMTIKPQEVVDEEDTKGAKAQYSREREASERSPRCHCVIL